MSIAKVAELAGVSTATVSRVLNNSPKVSSDTADAVRRVMKETNFARLRAPRQSYVGKRNARVGKIGFLIFGSSKLRSGQSGVFEELMHGISMAATTWGAEMSFSFMECDGEVPQGFYPQNVDGLLLFGLMPEPKVRQVIESAPTVWLMANLERPAWGDQVMPDNLAIGELAADYLVEHGHQNLAFVSVEWWGWYWSARARSFLGRAQQLSAEASIVSAGKIDLPVAKRKVSASADEIVDELLSLKPRPTGLFVGEDSQVPSIVTALKQRGIQVGPGRDMDIISCNHDTVHFTGMDFTPATIDIRPNVIGSRGVDLLRMRIESPGNERIRASIEPTLIPGQLGE